MNILILSAGTRNKVVQYFKKAIGNNGFVIATDMNNGLSKEDIDILINDTPVSRIGTPKDVAKAALYLASDDASFVTGEVMNLSGGYIV